jgi:hypothetical protein
MTDHPHRGAQRSLLCQRHGIGRRQRDGSIERAGIYVPSIICRGLIDEGLQLTAATTGRDGVKGAGLPDQMKDAAGSPVDGDTERRVLQNDQVSVRTALQRTFRLTTTYSAPGEVHSIAQRRNVAGDEEQPVARQ